MLIENTSATSKLAVQHGMSIFIAGERENYLFGLGSDGKLLTNAAKMKLPVGSVCKAVISHNHPAHYGGAEAMLKRNPELLIYAPSSAQTMGVKGKKEGIAALKEKYPDNVLLFRHFQEVGKDFYLMCSEFYNEEDSIFDKGEKILGEDGKAMPFNVKSECFGVLFPFERKEDGCVIVAGCSHCGAGNIIRTVKAAWQDVPVIAYVGGLHLMGSNTKKISVSGEYIQRLVQDFRELGVGTVYVCHCTGIKSYEELKHIMGERVQYLQTGEEIGF